MKTRNNKENDNNLSNNEAWKSATKIFNNLFDLPLNQALAKLNQNTEISAEIKQKVKKLFQAINQKSPILSGMNFGEILTSVKSVSDLTGKKIDNYKLTELIAVGGMSSIYKANRADTKVQKPVAIKVMSLQQSAEIITLFNREQKALSKLNHPNIVSFLHGGQTQDGIYYLVMEYIVSGTSLDIYVKENKSSVGNIVKMVIKVAMAMQYAHENLIIHGDLKSDNILVDRNDNIKVIDFGIAAFTYQSDSIIVPAYTPEIASPEQIKGENITTKTDVFSLAATLLKVLINDTPLPNFSVEKYDESADEKHVIMRLKESSLDADLSNILIKALRTDNNKRYFTMLGFANDLHNWSKKMPVTASKNSKTYRIRKFIYRNPFQTTVVLSFLGLLIYAFIAVKHYANNAQLEANNAKTTLNFMTNVLSQADPAHLDKGNTTIRQAFKIVMNQPDAIEDKNTEAKINILQEVTRIFEKLALYGEAAKTSEKIYQLYKLSEGEDSENTLHWKYELASYYHSGTQFEKGLKVAHEIIDHLDKKQLDYPAVRLNALNVIIKCHLERFENSIANGYCDIALKLIETGKIKDHEAIGRIYNSFAVLARRQKQFDLSAKFYQQSLDNIEKSVGKKSIAYATILSGFGRMYMKSKQYDKAKPYLLQAIEQAEAFDPNGHVLARNISHYANYLFKTGQFQAALDALDKATQLSEKRNHKFTLLVIQNKRYSYNSAINDIDAALDGISRSIQIAQDMYGISHKRTLKHKIELATILSVIKQSELAQNIISNQIKHYMDNQKINGSNEKIAILFGYAGLIEIQNNNIKSAKDRYYQAISFATKPAIVQILAGLLSEPLNIKDIPDLNADNIETLILKTMLTNENVANTCQISETFINNDNLLLKQIFIQQCLKQDLSPKVLNNFKTKAKQFKQATDPIKNNFKIRLQTVILLINQPFL